MAATTMRVGWIGTGIMGKSMCGHLIDAGYDVMVYNRTRAKCMELQNKGAKVVDSVAQVAEYADVVFNIVGYPTDVEQVILGPNGVLEKMKSGGIVVDMTTSEPSLAERIFEEARKRQLHAIDAPVSGGDTGAKQGTLSIMIGGENEAVQRIQPLLKHFGKNIRHMGPAGAGQHTKMINQILISTTMIGVVEGLLYAHKSGLDAKQVIEAVGAGAAASWSINNLGPRIAERNFDPGFMVEHFIKDMGIALKEAQALGLSLPGLALAHQFYLAVKVRASSTIIVYRLSSLDPV